MIELWNIFQAASVTEADADPMFVNIQTLTKGDVFVSKQSHQPFLFGKFLYVKKNVLLSSPTSGSRWNLVRGPTGIESYK